MPKIKIAVILLLASILAAFFVIFPLFREFMIEREILGLKREELREYEEHVSMLRTAEIELEAYTEELAMINRALPSDYELPSFIFNIERRAAENGLFFRDFGSFSTSPSEKFPNLQETKMEFLVSGSYTGFKRFIDSLESSIKIAEIENLIISVEERGEEDQGEELFFRVTIKTYSY